MSTGTIASLAEGCAGAGAGGAGGAGGGAKYGGAVMICGCGANMGG